MKKYMFILLFLLVPNVNAKSLIKDASINITVNSNGNASIKEELKIKDYNSKEFCRVFSSLGNSEITNFKVSTANKKYTFEDEYKDIKNKEYINGIKDNEMCFGLIKDNLYSYVISYDVSNVIYNTKDSQIFYYKFISDNTDFKSSEINISIKFQTNGENIINTFNKGYNRFIQNGSFYGNIDDKINSLIVQFNSDSFNSENTNLNFYYFKNFKELYEIEKSNYDFNNFKKIITCIYIFSPILIMVSLIIIYLLLKKHLSKIDYRRKKIKLKDLNYSNNIPNIGYFESFFLAYMYNLNKDYSNLIKVLLLKWLFEKQIEVKKTHILKGNSIKYVTIIDFSKSINTNNQKEKEIYNYILTNSKNGIITNNELIKACNKFCIKYNDWFNDLLVNYSKSFIKNGEIKIEYGKMVVSEKMHSDAKDLAKLKKYLKFTTKLDNIELWNKYLIYSQLFGYSKNILKNINNYYPDIIDNSEIKYTDINAIVLINNKIKKKYI